MSEGTWSLNSRQTARHLVDGPVAQQDELLDVLLVEDEALIMLDLSLSLERQGMGIAGEALTLEEGYRLADASCPDVAVLDINVGAEPVWPLARHLASKGITCVFVSANLHHEELCGEFATSPRLAKPATDDQLAAAIRLAAAQRPVTS